MTGVSVPEELGEPFAFGREADVYALADGTVLRRYRDGGDTGPEALVMRHVGDHGFPVPQVHAAGGADLVLERLDGPTMATVLLAGSMLMEDGAAILADLLTRLHSLPSISGDEQSVLHLDLHPENVVITAGGPVVIDWRNARDGEPDLDTAFTALILAQVATGAIEHPIHERVGDMLDLFLELAPGDPLRKLDEAVAMRSRQSTMSADEVGLLPVAAARVRGVR
ncbi:phosphotransferase [Paractinoplanes lichenicola]|uniref:phosphotransferase n=1 Tax=Paractinoplanes lichenicola TaxID=2802976 RepID=UPI0027DD9FA5|nr:phosphotransferase [Actinoplanes lichenicola]